MILEFNNQRMSFSNTRGYIRSRRSWISSLLIIGMVCIAAAITGSAAQAAPKTISEQMMVPTLTRWRAGTTRRACLPGRRVLVPFPRWIYHHGSNRVGGTNRNCSPQFWPPVGVIEYFTSRGWCVVAPSRRGRGGSEGLYDEGFTPERDHLQHRCPLFTARCRSRFDGYRCCHRRDSRMAICRPGESRRERH